MSSNHFNSTTRSYTLEYAGSYGYSWLTEALDPADFAEHTDEELREWVNVYVEQTIDNIIAEEECEDDEAKIAEIRSDIEADADSAVDYLRDWINKAHLETVTETDGIQSTYGGGDYTITIWDDMDEGYNAYLSLRNTEPPFEKRHKLNTEEALKVMREFGATPWVAVEYGS